MTRKLRTFVGTLSCALLLTATLASAQGQSENKNREIIPRNIQERIINLGSNISLRLTAGTGRLGDISARLERRIEKMEKEGYDMTASRAKLKEAKEELMSAILTLDSVTPLSLIVSGDNPQYGVRNIQTQYRDVRDRLMSVKTKLQETIALMKEATRNEGASEEGVSEAVTGETTE